MLSYRWSDEEQPMDAASDSIESLLPLTPAVFHILLVLLGGERHGYAIMREVETATGGAFHLGPGTLYRSIRQLLALGLIAAGEERVDPSLNDERRKYYRITARGRLAARAEAERLAQLVRLAGQRALLPAPLPRLEPGGPA
jgi:DNA-binding PadR family transcriptional regulator